MLAALAEDATSGVAPTGLSRNHGQRVEPSNPLDVLDVVETADAKEAAAFWRIVAAGRRPDDYFVRELLHGSLLRDRRAPWSRRYAVRQPDWIEDGVNHLSERERPAAVQHVALDFQHRRHLLRHIERQREFGGHADGPACSLLADLWCCAPQGVLLEAVSPGRRSLRYVCGHAWHCPWCLARRAVALHDRLRGGPLRNPAGKHLVLGRLRITGNIVGRPRNGWEPREAHLVRRYLGASLREEVTALGVTGGVVAYQLSPARVPASAQADDMTAGFQQDVNLLGEITLATEDAERAFLDGLRHVAGAPSLPGAWSLDWWIIRADDTNALRLMLAGCGPSYDLGRCSSLTSVDPCDTSLGNGVEGLLSLPPLFLLEEDQWDVYRLATNGLRLFDCFGSWRLRTGRPAEHDRFTAEHQRSLDRVNGQRRHVRDQRREKLRAAFDALRIDTMPPDRGRGRPARRRFLASELVAHGVPFNDRDLRWLMTQLPRS